MVMGSLAPDSARLEGLWRAIEDAHYSYLETDDSPDKIQQRKKLDGYIMEYLSIVPHECKFGLQETGKVFERTVRELAEFSACRAGLGWAAIARYAGNLLAQPWRKEYRTLRLYSGFYKHEVEANMVGGENLLQVMGYKPAGHGKMLLEGPICPDTVAAISRDALIAQCECQIMSAVWEEQWQRGVRVSWAGVAAARAHTTPRTDDARTHYQETDIYANIPTTVLEQTRLPDIRQPLPNYNLPHELLEDPLVPIMQPPYMIPQMVPQNLMYPIQGAQCPLPVLGPYGQYYYPVTPPYLMPAPMFAPIKQAANVPVNGYPINQYRYPNVPTAQLIELEPSVYENGKYEDACRRSRLAEHSRRNSTSKSGFSEVSLPSLPRSDTQPTLSKAKEDGMGTYESWDYVYRNLSSKDHDEGRSRYSPSVDRDSRTLDRLDREERRSKYQPTTLDLEDGLQALHLDRSQDEEVYRTAKVNENLMRLKQEQEMKRAKHAKKQASEEKKKKLEPIPNPGADGLIPSKIAPDKMRLLTKKDVKERKEVIKQQNSVNGSASSAELRKVRKAIKSSSSDAERPAKSRSLENGVHNGAHSSKSIPGPSNHQTNGYDLKTHLVVSLDETDSRTTNQINGDHEPHRSSKTPETNKTGPKSDKWQCHTCTYLNAGALNACEMCGKSKIGPEIQPLTSGGRECPACTLVNKREATVCDACNTSLDHCPTYI